MPGGGHRLSKVLRCVTAAALALLALEVWQCGSFRGADRNRVYRIGFGDDRPLHFRDEEGQPAGLAVAMVREAARRRGIRLTWINTARPSLACLLDGQVDFWIVLTDLPERRRLVHITDPFLETEYSLVVLADSPYRKTADLRNARIASPGFQIDRLRLASLLPQARHVLAGTPAAAFEALSGGRVDAAFLDQYSLGDLLVARGEGKKMRIVPAPVARSRMGLGARFDAAGAADEIRDEMRVMAGDGSLPPLFEGWSFFPGLNLEAMENLSRARLRERLWFGGVFTLLALLVGTLVLIARLNGQKVRLQRFERALRDSENRFRSLSDASLEGILIHDGGVVLDVNPALARLFGYDSPDELIGKNCLEVLLTPEARARVEERIRLGEFGVVELNAVKKDGTIFPTETETRELNYRGRNARLVAWRDITERRRSLAALRESEERYTALFDRSLDCVFLSDFEGRFLDANQAALDLLGYTREDLGSITYANLLTPEDFHIALQITRGMLTSGHQPGRTEYRIRRRDGGYVFVEIQSSVIYRSGQPFAIQGIARDITARKHAEEEQAALQARLHQTSKMESIGRLAGGVAHDFNNLLTVILGYSNKLLERTDRDHPFRRDLGQVLSAADKAAALTRQLLTFSRKHTGSPKVISLDETVVGIEAMLRRLIEEHIEVILSPSAPQGFIFADPGLIEQVIVNLAVNGRDAMPNGGKLFIETSRLTVSDDFAAATLSVPHGDYLTLAVADTGAGMTREVESRLFEPFFTTKEPGKGTGLGLATVYGIVKQAAGFIKVHSTAGIGTSFRVFFPAADKQPAAEAPVAEDRDLDGHETILLVEDESGVRNYVREELLEHGYCVLDAASAAQALSYALGFLEPIDLLLTDMVLPGMNGMELIRELQSIRPDIPVLRMSGYPERFGTQLNEGVSHLQKPFTANELLSRVRKTLDDAKAVQSQAVGL